MKTNYHDFTTIDTPAEERKRLGVGDIWLNRAKCKKCGDIIQSDNLHDLVSCKCGTISVDGGSWYLKRVGDYNLVEEMFVRFNDIKKDEQNKTNI
jgi:hypothetical protein